MELKERVIVITGASRGLGKALAFAFAKEGVKLVLAARSKDELDAITKQTQAIAVPTDVRREEDVKHLAEIALGQYGQIDIWINNAGVRIPRAPIEEADMGRVHEMFEVNVFGVMYGSRTAFAHMKKQQRGIIVNILSTLALKGVADAAPYCASKGAAIAFTNSFRFEAARERVTVIGVYPGGMKTSFFDSYIKPKGYDQFLEPNLVAERIIENLKLDKPEDEVVVKRQEE